MINFLHAYLPQSILFDFGGIQIHWYGFLIALGLAVGYFLARSLANYYKIKKDDFLDLFFYLLVGGILGARIYYVIYAWPFYREDLLEIFKIWHGGLAIHGVIIGGLLSLFLFSRSRKISFWLLADLLVPALAIGQAIGRWGNYFNQELFGKPTLLPWGIPIEGNSFYSHPTFLYESFGNLMIFGALFSLNLLVFKKKIKLLPGSILGIYLMSYSVLRFLMEFIRVDYTNWFWGLRTAQWASILLFVIGLVIVFFRRQSSQK